MRMAAALVVGAACLLALPLLYHAGRPDGSTTVSLLGYRHRMGESRAGSLLTSRTTCSTGSF